MSPPVGVCWPESTSKSSSWPCASSAAIPRISPGRSANETSLSVSPTCSPRTSSAVGPSASSIRSRSGVASATPAARATSSPSMYSTIFSSPPSCGIERADVAAVAEHGRAVAVRDHLAQAVGDEERRAAALLLAAHHVEDALGEVGGERRRDLVQDQELRVAGERAREIDHPQQRQRHVVPPARRSRCRARARAGAGGPRRRVFSSAAGSARPSGRARARDPGRRARARSAPPAPETRRCSPRR